MRLMVIVLNERAQPSDHPRTWLLTWSRTMRFSEKTIEAQRSINFDILSEISTTRSSENLTVIVKDDEVRK